MSLLVGTVRLSPSNLRLVILLLLGIGIFVGSGAIAWAEEGDLDKRIDEVAGGVTFTWTLLAAFLVFFMQAGFAFLGAGLIRSKSTVNYMTKSFLDFCIAALSFWAFGFALTFGGSAAASGLTEGNSIIGFSGFFLGGAAEANDTAMLWIFQMVFAGTAATIVAGAMAERTQINAYLAYSFIVGAIIYPIYGHWVWGGGWLSEIALGAGAVDFAGSDVVHAVGGLVALAGAMTVGPRIGKFNADGTPNEIPGHNMPYVLLGTFILFLRLVRLQRRQHPVRHGFADRDHSDQHTAGRGSRRRCRNAPPHGPHRQDGPGHILQWRPGGSRGYHSSLRLRRAVGRGGYRRRRSANHDAQH